MTSRCPRCGSRVALLGALGLCAACVIAVLEGPVDPRRTPKAARDAAVRQAASSRQH